MSFDVFWVKGCQQRTAAFEFNEFPAKQRPGSKTRVNYKYHEECKNAFKQRPGLEPAIPHIAVRHFTIELALPSDIIVENLLYLKYFLQNPNFLKSLLEL